MIVVNQSDLNRLGVRTPWNGMGYRERLAVTARVLRSKADLSNALLIEMNNPNAIASIRYVNDIGQCYSAFA